MWTSACECGPVEFENSLGESTDSIAAPEHAKLHVLKVQEIDLSDSYPDPLQSFQILMCDQAPGYSAVLASPEAAESPISASATSRTSTGRCFW